MGRGYLKASSPKLADIILAPYDAERQMRVAADFVCDGINDDIDINAAMNSLISKNRGRILLLPGNYNTANPMLVDIADDTVRKLVIDAYGAFINYSGSDDAIKLIGHSSGGPTSEGLFLPTELIIRGLTPIGTGSAKTGIHVTNFTNSTWYDTYIRGFSSGCGLLIDASDYWSEATKFYNLRTQGCKYGFFSAAELDSCGMRDALFAITDDGAYGMYLPMRAIGYLTADVAAGQKVIPMDMTIGFIIGQHVRVYDTQHYEDAVVSAINPGISITLQNNLVNAYTVGNSAKVYSTHTGNAGGSAAPGVFSNITSWCAATNTTGVYVDTPTKICSIQFDGLKIDGNRLNGQRGIVSGPNYGDGMVFQNTICYFEQDTWVETAALINRRTQDQINQMLPGMLYLADFNPVNLLTNGSFEQALKGWTITSANANTVASPDGGTTPAFDGGYCLQLTSTSASEGTAKQSILNFARYKGKKVALLVHYFIPSTGGSTKAIMNVYDGVKYTYFNIINTITDSWQTATVVALVDPDANQLTAVLSTGPSISGATVYFDAVMLVEGNTAVDYYDRPISQGDMADGTYSHNNILPNGSFEKGFNDWTVVNATPTIPALPVVDGPQAPVYGNNIGLITSTGTYGLIKHLVSNYAFYRGKTVTLGLWYFIPTGGYHSQNVSLYDGFTYTKTYLTKTGGWAYASITKTINASASELKVTIQANEATNIGDILYVDAVILAEGLSVPDYCSAPVKKDNVSSGTGTITAGQVFVNVPHKLSATPTRVILTPTTASGDKKLHVAGKGATNITVNIEAAHTSDISFDFLAIAGDL